MRYIRLSEEEKQELEHLQKTSTSFVIRGRCRCLLLSANGHSMTMVSALTNVHRQTLLRLFDRWNAADVNDKFSSLYSAKGQGAKIKLQPVAAFLPELVNKHSRNLKPILDRLIVALYLCTTKVEVQLADPSGLYEATAALYHTGKRDFHTKSDKLIWNLWSDRAYAVMTGKSALVK